MFSKTLKCLCLFFILYISSASAENCILCKQPISGKYAITEKGSVCMQCYVKHQAVYCSGCKTLIQGRYLTVGPDAYCTVCAAKVTSRIPQNNPDLTCSMCKSKIAGKYGTFTEDDGKIKHLCVQCLRKTGQDKVFTCVKCNRPINDSNFVRDQDEHGLDIYTCVDCISGKSDQRYSGKVSCSICSNPIKAGASFYSDGISGRPYCQDCKAKYKKCVACAMPVTDNAYSDPLYPTCTFCRKTAVTTKAQLDAIYSQVRSVVKKYCGMEAPISPDRVIFADISAMRNAATKRFGTDGPPIDYSGNPVGLFSSNGNINSSTISVAKGMPEIEMYETLAHEYGHACHYNHGIKDSSTPLEFSEGIAEWVSYKALSAAGQTKYYYYKAKNKNSIYGGGFRKILLLEKKLGTNGLLEYIQTHSSFSDK